MDSGVLQSLAPLHDDSYGWALACCDWQRDLAEDILQEAYLRVSDGRARFAQQSTLRTWFFGVIRRVAQEQRRQQQRSSLLGLRLLNETEVAADGQGSQDSIYEDGSVRQLQAALGQLPMRQREVLHLVFYSDLTLEEVAQTLQVSIGSARTHYHRGKQRMAKLLRGSHDAQG